MTYDLRPADSAAVTRSPRHHRRDGLITLLPNLPQRPFVERSGLQKHTTANFANILSIDNEDCGEISGGMQEAFFW